MSFESDLVDLIESASAVYSLVGNDSKRICQSMSANPSLTRPYLIFDVLSTNEPRAMTGSSLLRESLVQFRFVHTSMALAITFRETFRSAFQAYQVSSGANTIRSMTLQEHRPAYGYPQSGEPLGVFAVEADWLIWHTIGLPIGLGD